MGKRGSTQPGSEPHRAAIRAPARSRNPGQHSPRTFGEAWRASGQRRRGGRAARRPSPGRRDPPGSRLRAERRFPPRAGTAESANRPRGKVSHPACSGTGAAGRRLIWELKPERSRDPRSGAESRRAPTAPEHNTRRYCSGSSDHGVASGSGPRARDRGPRKPRDRWLSSRSGPSRPRREVRWRTPGERARTAWRLHPTLRAWPDPCRTSTRVRDRRPRGRWRGRDRPGSRRDDPGGSKQPERSM